MKFQKSCIQPYNSWIYDCVVLVLKLSVCSVLNIINHEISNKDREKVKYKKNINEKKTKEEEKKEIREKQVGRLLENNI